MTFSIIQKSQLDTILAPFDTIFDKEWVLKRPNLQYPLVQNEPYRMEINKWMKFFQSKGWLTPTVIKRLRTSRTFESFYSKINEFRCGYFFEKILHFKLSGYEVRTINNKDVEFEGFIDDTKVIIEVKSPMDYPLDLMYCGSFNNSGKVFEVISKSIEKLPKDVPAIIVLSDGLNVTLFADPMAQNAVWKILENKDYKKISAICILGNIYHQDMYKIGWAVNSNANYPINEDIFAGYQKIPKL
jgi:hypothetical protein